MESWTTGVLKDAVLFKNGKASKERLDKGTFPLMGSNGQIGFANSSNAREGCLVIGRVGAYCGSIFHLNSDSWVTDNAILGTVYNEYDSRYVFYKLSRLGLREFAGGSAQPLLNQSILNRIKVTFPPLPEQKRIAEILGALDDKIELNLEINKTLEAMAMTLFKEWFVDFGPFRDGGMVDSELGPIPKGWKSASMADMSIIKLGGTPARKKSEYWNGDINWINSGEINKFRIVAPSEKITALGLRKSATKLIPSQKVSTRLICSPTIWKY